MAALEGEWRKRERVREAEIASMRGEYAALEERTKQVRSLISVWIVLACCVLSGVSVSTCKAEVTA